MATAFKQDLPVLTDEYVTAIKGLHVGIYIITGREARKLLSRNKMNRKMAEMNRLKLREDLLNGRFVLNGESIIFAWDGTLLNGQHRLEECAETGVPITSVVVFGVDPTAIETMDQGKTRTTGDILTMKGVPNANMVASISRHLASYHRGDGKTLGRVGSTSRASQTAALSERPDVVGIAAWANHFQRDVKGMMSPSMLGLARAIIEPKYGDEGVFFLERVALGDNLSADAPAFAVRKRLLSHPKRASFPFAIECLLRGVVAHMEGRTLSRIQTHSVFPDEFWFS